MNFAQIIRFFFILTLSHAKIGNSKLYLYSKLSGHFSKFIE